MTELFALLLVGLLAAALWKLVRSTRWRVSERREPTVKRAVEPNEIAGRRRPYPNALPPLGPDPGTCVMITREVIRVDDDWGSN